MDGCGHLPGGLCTRITIRSVKCMVIGWNKNGWVDPNLDTDGKEADRDTIRTPSPSPVNKVVPVDRVREHQSAL